MLYFSLFDKKVGEFGSPIASLHQADMIRDLQRAISTPTSKLSLFPSDFDLYLVAEWNSQLGVFENTEHPKMILNLVTIADLVASQNLQTKAERTARGSEVDNG